jgi:tetratricopeptide (TPR) repeat protein
MKSYQRYCIAITVSLLGFSAAISSSSVSWEHHSQSATTPSDQTSSRNLAIREDAYRANNLGVALLEQYKYKLAAEAFQRALQIEPQLALARVNLSIALYNDRNLDGAWLQARAAAELMPEAPQPHYLMGLMARAQSRTDDAMAAFQRVLQLDQHDVGTHVNLGQLYLQQGKFDEAVSHFRAALAAEPYQATAAYNLALALLRSGQRAEGQRMMQQFEALRKGGYGTTLGQNYLEQGRYAEAIVSTGAEPELVDRNTPDVTFTDATASIIPAMAKAKPQESSSVGAPMWGRHFKASDLTSAAKRDLVAAFGGSVTLFDYDSDGDLDLFEVTPFDQRLYQNDGGKFVDATERAGLASNNSSAIGTGAMAGDYDNDGKPDLFVLRYGGSGLYHNDGNGKFSDVTAAAGIPMYPYLALSAAFVDVDHDGDLDIFIAGLADLARAPKADANGSLTFPDDFAGAPNALLRNNGDGKFSDITAAAQVAGAMGHAVAVVPTDYDNRRDIDLLVINYGDAPVLFRNLRDGTFGNVASEVGLNTKDRYTCAAAGDVNKDGYTDFFFGRADGPGLLAMSDGQARFVTSPAPAGSESASAAQFLDYDHDGLLDLVLISNGGLRVWRNAGNQWLNASDRAVAPEFQAGSSSPTAGSPRTFASGDVDGDGDTDLIVRSAGRLRVARNDGGNRNRSFRVRIAGRVSNRSGVGTKIEIRAGSLRQKLETYAASPAPAPADVVFGLGKRAAADAVRVLWPSGIVQSETEITQSAAPAPAAKAPSPPTMIITELDRKPSSCPYLYTWNGRRFEFITDFMGGGEMGSWEAPGVRNHPDPDEYVRIRDDQLKPRRGRYEIRITNELEEVLFVDRLQLLAVAHPADVEVFPNEGMVDPPRPFQLFTTHHAHPPVRAVDDHGHDVLSRIAQLDRQYPDDFSLHHIRGYAEEHTLTLDLGEPSAERTLLLLTGWTDYAFSSDNVAAYQSGLSLKPPALQVKEASGHWQTVIPDIGIPVGRPQTIVLDLTGKFLTPSREVRLVTNMRIYWDQILVDTSSGDVPMRLTRLEPVMADLHWRGFSAEVSPDGREPLSYDYEHVSLISPWKVMPGRYTREGDVRELLRRTDDRFVISRPGDEIAVAFAATALPPLPPGWKHTFLLYADGFSKEMDINSASPDQVAPLPFHGMKRYPYAAAESHPMTRAHRAYIERYNTRVVVAPLPQLLVGLGP